VIFILEARCHLKRGLMTVLGAFGIFLAAGAAMGQAAGPYQFYSITPCRLADTRFQEAPALSSGAYRGFQVVGRCNIPNTAKVASLNVTFVQPTLEGFITVWPYGPPFPMTSNINAPAGTPAIANAVVTPITVGWDGTGYNIYIVYGTAVAGGTAHVIVDINGYYQ
jgi:hypothetical protein